MQDNPDPALFGAEVRNCAGGSVELGLWSAKVCYVLRTDWYLESDVYDRDNVFDHYGYRYPPTQHL